MSVPAPGARWRAQVARDWDETGHAWERWEPFLMYALHGVNVPLLRALRADHGHRVLDIGCGLGEPTLTVAAWVGPTGSVLGIDVARSMVDAARRRARVEHVRNATFRRADITRLRAPHEFDRAISRFGVMFADDVPAMLGAVHAALRPGGRAAFAVWAPLAMNPYFQLTAEAMAPYLEEVPDPEHSPHPMRFARRGRLEAELQTAGFHGVETETARVSFVYPSPEIFADVQMETSGTLRRIAGKLSARAQRRIRESMAEAAAAHLSGSVVRIPGVAWIISGDVPAARGGGRRGQSPAPRS